MNEPPCRILAGFNRIFPVQSGNLLIRRYGMGNQNYLRTGWNLRIISFYPIRKNSGFWRKDVTALQKATTQNQTCVMAFCIFHVFKLL